MKTTWMALALGLAVTPLSFAAEDDDPPEYRERTEARDAYRRGYERGFERGFQKGLAESQKRPAIAPPPAPPLVMLGPIQVSRASYGTSSKNCNATRFVARQADGHRSHSFGVTNAMCGDPAHGDRKTLEVTYQCGQVVKTASAREHQTIYLDCNS